MFQFCLEKERWHESDQVFQVKDKAGWAKKADGDLKMKVRGMYFLNL